MKRIFTLILEALALVAVALISAFISMRVAIHGREAVVPTLTGLTVADATDLARRDGLRLTLENRFYSAGVAPGRILAQDPEPGSRVRREWPIRITESLGTQAVNIPDLTGESERAATVSIRRLSLDLGTVAHLAVPGDPGVVLAQTPPANTGGVDGPRVSLLISDPPETALPPAYVMPSLLGLSWSAAAARAATAGLHLIPDTALPTAQPALVANSAPQAPTQAAGQSNPPPAFGRPGGVVVAQNPQPGRRVAQGDAVHVTLGAPTQAAGPASSP
jgi:beta-lactam-binding protein with PASTA domain